MSPYLIFTFLIALWLWEKISHAIDARAWRAERRDLLNRVQCGTVRDYALVRDVIEPQPPPKPTRAPDVEPPQEQIYYNPEPPVDMVEAQEAARGLMGG